MVADRLILPTAVAQAAVIHALEERPNEACGLVSGSIADGTAVAFHPARNSEASPLRYNVHPDDLVSLTFEIEEAGLDLLAIFHSHTRSPAEPSPTDLRAAMYPDAFYLLASLTDPEAPLDKLLRAWRIRNRTAREVPLLVDSG